MYKAAKKNQVTTIEMIRKGMCSCVSLLFHLIASFMASNARSRRQPAAERVVPAVCQTFRQHMDGKMLRGSVAPCQERHACMPTIHAWLLRIWLGVVHNLLYRVVHKL